MNCIQPERAGGGDVEVAAVVGLDLVDRGEDLPAHAVLDAGGLVDGEEEGRDAELVDEEVRHADRRRGPGWRAVGRVGRGRASVGALDRGGRGAACFSSPASSLPASASASFCSSFLIGVHPEAEVEVEAVTTVPTSLPRPRQPAVPFSVLGAWPFFGSTVTPMGSGVAASPGAGVPRRRRACRRGRGSGPAGRSARSSARGSLRPARGSAPARRRRGPRRARRRSPWRRAAATSVGAGGHRGGLREPGAPRWPGRRPASRPARRRDPCHRPGAQDGGEERGAHERGGEEAGEHRGEEGAAREDGEARRSPVTSARRGAALRRGTAPAPDIHARRAWGNCERTLRAARMGSGPEDGAGLKREGLHIQQVALNGRL